MKNINETIYLKLTLQAKEAEEQGFSKLAEAVLSSLTPHRVDEKETYSSLELKSDIYNKLWKIAIDVITYHNLESVDIQKIDDTLSNLTSNVISKVEATLNVEDLIGISEPKLPGEVK